MNLQQARERSLEDTARVCIFGDPKTGKSTLASTAAELGYNLIWFSLDNGHSILHKLSKAAQDRVELVILPDTKDFPVAVSTMLKVLTGAERMICHQHGQVDCKLCKTKSDAGWTRVCLNELTAETICVLDHAGQLSDSAMNYVILDSIKNKMKDATGEYETDPDVFKCGLDQYALHGRIMNKILTNIQQMPVNWIVITHTCESEMEDGKKKLVPLVGSTVFSRNSGKYFDHIIYSSVGNRKHSVGSSSVYDTKAVTGSRTGVEIEKETKPTLASFFNKVKAAKRAEIAKAVVDLEEIKEEITQERNHDIPTSGQTEASVEEGNIPLRPVPGTGADDGSAGSDHGTPPAVGGEDPVQTAKLSIAEKLARLRGAKP